jgi:Flp pilus assembly protein TadG
MKLRWRFGGGQRGAVAVEAGISILVLVPLVVGLVEIGRAIYAFDLLVKSTRAAARYLAVGKPEEAARQLGAKCIVVTGSPASGGGSCSGSAQLPGLTLAMVTVLEPSTSDAVKNIATGFGTMNVVTVSVAGYPLSTLGTALVPNLTFGPISATVPQVFF